MVYNDSVHLEYENDETTDVLPTTEFYLVYLTLQYTGPRLFSTVG